MANIVFIAASLDGYIADKDGKIDWLYSVPNPENIDMGFIPLMDRIDAIVMGRNTFDIVLSFDLDWPYTKPVFVLSNTMTSVPKGYEDKITLLKGNIKTLLAELNQQGFNELYIDGGLTIQHFLKADLIDEMIITTFPILLGSGAPLFGDLNDSLSFQLVKSEIILDQLTQSTYLRKK